MTQPLPLEEFDAPFDEIESGSTKKPLSPEELGVLFEKIESEPTGKLSELAKIAGLSLAEDYIGADLSHENLSEDNLSGINLTDANLSGADLSRSDLRRANLSGVDLSDANLRGANLTDANLRGANLTEANLRGANLRGANLDGANLDEEPTPEVIEAEAEIQTLAQLVLQELQGSLKASSRSAAAVAERIAREVARICDKSNRIQNSGEVQSWQISLSRHRIGQILAYYNLGSNKGRVELNSNLSMMVYRHVAPAKAQFGFQARYNLIEDFLQNFNVEVLRAFRREHEVAANYSPRTRVELAEYMAFTEQYAKRRISLPGRKSQQLVILRAQSFAKGQPPETSIDMELAVESAKGEEDEMHGRSAAMQQVREQMVSEAVDPSEAVMRDRVIQTLMDYLTAQGQSDCADYLTLKLQDYSEREIDDILNLSSQQRDYLQQCFKYHVEKFAHTNHWKLVHQWLGADLDKNLGMSPGQWQDFLGQLTPQQQQLLKLKQAGVDEAQIAKTLKCTPKQAQKRWTKVLNLAWQARNVTIEFSDSPSALREKLFQKLLVREMLEKLIGSANTTLVL